MSPLSCGSDTARKLSASAFSSDECLLAKSVAVMAQ